MKRPLFKQIQTLSSFPTRLPLRSDLNLPRKLWHMMMGLFMVACYLSGVDRTTCVVILGSFLSASLIIEFARLRHPKINELTVKFWGPIIRSNEVNRMSGIPFYLASALLAFGIFPKPVALLSLLYLAVGDPIASLFGILYGKKGPKFANGKTLVGTAAGVISCALATVIFLQITGVGEGHVLALAVIGGLVGGTVELLPIDLDDNFTIPVISGFVLWAIFILFGI